MVKIVWIVHKVTLLHLENFGSRRDQTMINEECIYAET